MARIRLTDISISQLKATAAYREITDVSGLLLAIWPLPSDKKSFLTRYRRPDTKQSAKLTHGKYPELSLRAARVAHAQALAAVAEGTDPGASKQRAKISAEKAAAARRADTVELHVRQYLDRRNGKVGDGHWKQARLYLGELVRPYCDRPISEITRRELHELIDEIANRRGEIAANRARTHMRRFFGELVKRTVTASSPCDGIDPPAKETPRDRVLAMGEVKLVHDALTTIGGPTADGALMMLYSGQRRSECANMRRSEIQDGMWSLPTAKVKNRRPHSVPLTKQMLELIERQPVLGDYVFTYTGDKPVSKFSDLKLQVDKIAKLDAPWVWHDLRRTCASHLARLGVSLPVIEKILNHASGSFRGIVAVYQRHDYANEKRDALATWGREVERTVTGEEPGKVVKFRS